jgi:hypothetical protein
MERKKTLRNHGLRDCGLSKPIADLERLDPMRALAREAAKLDISEEQTFANEVYVGEVEWPEY